ncbi:MAG: inverse autotransporter beta domain-containing protein [Verrucomicrobia bacterium]|nr:inverse autotransporter beta domain-containing protein [Verrucomicrobiota bacterium]
MRTIRNLLFSFSLLAIIPLAATMTSAQTTWVSEVEVQALLRKHRGGFGGIAFNPLLQDRRSLSFYQAEFGWFQDQYDFSLGFGYRQRPTRSFAWGVNAFGDYGLNAQSTSFFQIGVGAELFGPCWIARANGYFPAKLRQLEGTHTVKQAELGGPAAGGIGQNIINTSFSTFDYRRTYAGFDVEVGAMVDLGPGELWGFVKGFYYDAPEVDPVVGPAFTVLYRTKPLPGWGAEVYFGGEWQWDRIHESQGSIVVGVRIPLCTWNFPICGGARQGPWDCWDNINRHMNWDVGRQAGVFNEIERSQVNFPRDIIGLAIFVNNGGTGLANGTQDNATGNTVAVATAAPNLIVLLGDQGDITANFTMVNGQTIAGFGGAPSVTVPVVNGHALKLTALPGQSVLANIKAGGGIGIALPGAAGSPQNLTIQNISIRDATTAISGSGFNHALLIDNVTIENPSISGISLTNIQNSAKIQNSKFNGPLPSQGISVQQTAGIGTVVITKNQFSALAKGVNVGVASGSTLKALISSNTFTNQTTAAVNATLTTGLLPTRIFNNTINSSAAGVILNSAGTGADDSFPALIDQNTFNNTVGASISVVANGTNVGPTNVTATNNTDTRANGNVPYQFQRSGANNPLSVAFTGNKTNSTTPEVTFNNVTNDSTLFNVQNLDKIQGANNGIAPSIPGFPVTNITTPVTPPPPIP